MSHFNKVNQRERLFDEFHKITSDWHDLNQIIQNYEFITISKKSDFDNHELLKSINESNIIIVNKSCDLNLKSDDQYIYIGTKNKILIIRQSLITLLETLFLNAKKLVFCFLSNTKEIFDSQLKLSYQESKCHPDFQEEINSISNQLIIKVPKNDLSFHHFKTIRTCISAFVIKQSYSKLADRIQLFNNEKSYINQNCNEEFDENDFLELRCLGAGSVSNVNLIYHIKKEELFAIKKQKNTDSESEKVGQREIANYSKINFIFFPKFIGKLANSNNLIIEYINGHTLYEIQNINLTEDEKFIIIFQLMMSIEYLHRNHFVYRDLKPTNIIIDENKTAVIIDLDRMILNKDASQNKNHTNIFSSVFAAPEINYGTFSYKCDIYSIGQIIYFILNEKNPPENINKELFFHSEKISEIYKKCTNENENERPSIIELILDFYNSFQSKFINENFIQKFIQRINDEIKMENEKIQQENLKKAYMYFEGKSVQRDINKAIHYLTLAANQNNVFAQHNLGFIYIEGKEVKKDINKSIHFFKLAANQNNVNSQYELGLLYSEGKEIPVDINKAIHYYELASNQNHVQSQFNLGVIYYKGQYISRDINKSIKYLSLAADHKYPQALFNLGLIYFEGKYVPRDINKSLHFYFTAAEENFPQAQLNLGNIYYNGIHVKRDIEKAIHYYKLASNNNYDDAQYNLGNIYYENKYIKQDIKKAIHYYLLSANQNNSKAQLILGKIYYEGHFISRDIIKAIHYLVPASNQDEPEASFILGVIYFEGIYVNRNINKAIHYFTLSANKNYSEAQFNLGLIYSNDKYGVKDIHKSIHYYSLSADQNNSRAQINLGEILYESQLDIKKAIHYLSLAAIDNIG